MKKFIFYLMLVIVFIINFHSFANANVLQNTLSIVSETPIAVVTGKALGEEAGAPYQFPGAGKTIDGNIFVCCSGIGREDSAQSYESEVLYFLSSNEGQTWLPIDKSDLKITDTPLKNGEYLQGVVAQNSYQADWIENYTPAYSQGNLKLYYAKDVPEFIKSIRFEAYDSIKDEFYEFEANFNWEYMPVIVNNGWIMPLQAYAYLSQIYAYDDKLYMIMYSYGFNSNNGSVTNNQYNTYIFESTDYARTWNYKSQILACENVDIAGVAGFDGYTEANIIHDGNSFHLLVRTGSGRPLYYSTTRDITSWPQPQKFQNYNGVRPKLCLLENKALVASFGRPGIFVTATRDRETWCEPLIIDDRPTTADDSRNYSCCYTSIVPISGNEVLLFYSDFKYPVEGKEVKALLCRKIKFNVESSQEDDPTKPTFRSHSLILDGEIGVNFYMNLPEIAGVDYTDKAKCYMEFDINGDKSNSNKYYDASVNYAENGKTYYGFRCYTSSVQMADTITATLHYGDGLTVSQEYSVKEYLETVLGGEFTGSAKDLMVAIQNYGYYAQQMLSKANNWTIGKEFATMPRANQSDYDNTEIQGVKADVAQYEIVRDTGSSQVKEVSYSLLLDSKTTINIYLEMKDGYTGSVFATIDGGTENIAVKLSEKEYLIQIRNIPVHELSKVHTIAVTAGESFNIKVAALSYVYTVLNSEADTIAGVDISTMKNAVTALYKYYETAIAYANDE